MVSTMEEIFRGKRGEKRTPSIRSSLRHDVKMSREAILIGHRAPLLITLGGTKVGNHDGNGLSRTCAVTCVLSWKCAQVCQFVALSAATAAPGAAATEQVGTPSSCVDIASTGLPCSRAATSTATGTFLAIEIMLPSSSASGN